MKDKAFTLIELLVTIFIIVLLLSVAIPAFNNYGRYNELWQFAQTIKSDFLTAKNYALSPPSDKTSGVDKYIMTFYKQLGSESNNYFELKEEKLPDLAEKPALMAASAGGDYSQTIFNGDNMNPLDQIAIAFSISQHGEITSPNDMNKVIVRLISNRISSSKNDNYVDIIINLNTGGVELKPAWEQ